MQEEGIRSWRLALDQGQLTESQRTVLEGMVRDGEAASLEEAAVRLDWQDSLIHPDEHMWGF